MLFAGALEARSRGRSSTNTLKDHGRDDHHAEGGGNRQYGCVASPHDALFSTTLSGGSALNLNWEVQPVTARRQRRRIAGERCTQLPSPESLNDVDRWFEQTARRSRTPVSLYPSLLTGRIGTYFAYRLRYPFLIATVRFAVHVAEFFILLSSLGGVAAFTVMVLRAGSLIVAGGWWGLLEVMRERLRRFAHAGQREASEYEIGRWLVLSVIVGLAVMAAGAAACGHWPAPAPNRWPACTPS